MRRTCCRPAATTERALLLTAAGTLLVLAEFGAPALSQEPSAETQRPAPLRLTVDADDDDDDGVLDAEQIATVPHDELAELVLRADSGPLRISALGDLRVIRQGIPIPLPATIPQEELPLPVFVQARAPSRRGQPLALLLERGGETERIDMHAVELRLLDAQNRPLDPSRRALAPSRRVTNDRSLPRSTAFEARSRGARNVRVQIVDSRAGGKRLKATLEAINPRSGRVRSRVRLELGRSRIGQPFRSPFVRLVGDGVDQEAHGVAGQVLLVGLRDVVRVTYEGGGRRTDGSTASHEMRVGRPGHEDGPDAARTAALRVVVLRTSTGGAPVIGVDDASALRIVRDEVSIANEIWLQCLTTFGPPGETAVAIEDPPGATLLAVADGDGLPAAGGGLIRFRVNGRPVPPIATTAGATPERTASLIARALEAAGFSASVTVNPKTVFGTGASADVLVRARDGSLVKIAPVPGVPLSSDARQRLSIGEVDLGDGLGEFDNMTATSGTLEERTLIKALSDRDASTIDLFIVNRFTHGTRQGEAFIEASEGPIVNTVVLDRNGLRQRQTAWTMAHEIGHVLLNQPLHPDNVGPDRPYLLMDSDNNRGTVNGPKRLSDADCQRVRHESGVEAIPALLRRHVD
ncbi:MAG: hypothetical protein OXT09_26765 [Myxococcales bacterium]|nr:hypothetical protein [Myxococcales bacterium]